jgi:hypothetical protein
MNPFVFKSEDVPYNIVSPYSNIDGKYVNVHNSDYAGFGSTESPSKYGLPEPRSNVDAAASKISGGMKRKIKNIVHKYMKGGKTNTNTKNKTRVRKLIKSMKIKRNIKSKNRKTKTKTKTKPKTKTRKSRSRRGGHYMQYGSNVPNTPTFETGGILASSESALANPVPFKTLSHCTNCVDNYNHFTNKGTPSF